MFDQRYCNCNCMFSVSSSCLQPPASQSCPSPQKEALGVSSSFPTLRGSPVSQVKNQDLRNIWIFPKSGLSFWPWNSLFLLISISLFLLDIHQLPLIKPSSVLLLVLCWFLEDQNYLLKFYLSYKMLLKHNLLLNSFPEAPMEYSFIHSFTH